MIERPEKATQKPPAAHMSATSPSEQQLYTQSSQLSIAEGIVEEAPAFQMSWAQPPTHGSREGSLQSQSPSVITAPLRARRGMLNDKKLTINVVRKTAEPVPLSARSPRSTQPAIATHQQATGERPVASQSPSSTSPTAPMDREPSNQSFYFEPNQERSKPRLLSQQVTSPLSGQAPSSSINTSGSKGFHLPFSPAVHSANSKVSTGSSGKTAVSTPHYGLNPAFGFEKVSPVKPSPKSGKGYTPRSPWFKDRPTLSKDATSSPFTPIYIARDTLAVPGSPRTPMTARSQKASPGSYQGMMLTTTTKRPSLGQHNSSLLAVPSPRDKRASFTTDLRNFVLGGAEAVPRLELRRLQAHSDDSVPSADRRLRSNSLYPTKDGAQESPVATARQIQGRSRSHSLAPPRLASKEVTSPMAATPKPKTDKLSKRASMPAAQLATLLQDRQIKFAPEQEENDDLYVQAPAPTRLESMRRPSYAASVFQQAKLMERKPSYYPTTVPTDLEEGEEDEEGVARPPTSVSIRPGHQTVDKPEDLVDSVAQEPEVEVKARKRSKRATARHYLLAPYRFLAWQFSPKFIWSIIDPTEYIWPMTLQKAALFTLYAIIITGLVMLDRYFHWWRGLSHALHGKNYIVMGILYGFEPAMIMIIMLVADVPMPREPNDRTVLLPKGTDSESASIMEDASIMQDSSSEHTAEDQNLDVIPEGSPRSGYFDPRARRATIIMHGNLDLERFASRRPSAQSNLAMIMQPSPEIFEEKKDIVPTQQSIPIHGHPSLTETTALVIPCHNSDVETLQAVLFAALVHFEPWQIFIIDNSNAPAPTTDLEGAIRSQPMFKRVNYVWLPVGNKNISQFVGATAAAKFGLNYVLTIDDDVIIPPNFAAPMHLMNDKVSAVCYPITAVDTKGDRPLFVAWQDIEYKMSALSKMAESKLCGVLYPHGAASFWDRDVMIQVLRNHDLIYFADDVKMGLELQALGKLMGIDASISFETVAPETYLGPPRGGAANYYNQRVRSWEMARHTLYWQFAKRFLFSLNGATTPVAIGWQKFTQFYVSTGNFIDWIRLPVFIILGGSKEFWLKSFAFILFLPILPLIPYRFWKVRKRPDLHPNMIDILTYGIYKLLYSFCCILGALRGMLYFFPNYKHKPNLIEMETADDPRCIWLRPAFMEEAAAIAKRHDEAEPLNVLVAEPDIQEEQSDLVHELRS